MPAHQRDKCAAYARNASEKCVLNCAYRMPIAAGRARGEAVALAIAIDCTVRPLGVFANGKRQESIAPDEASIAPMASACALRSAFALLLRTEKAISTCDADAPVFDDRMAISDSAHCRCMPCGPAPRVRRAVIACERCCAPLALPASAQYGIADDVARCEKARTRQFL